MRKSAFDSSAVVSAPQKNPYRKTGVTDRQERPEAGRRHGTAHAGTVVRGD